ncbi:hypothetical protein IFY67_02675 [Klebsiella pneumoniae]|nr:hypothetical protein IFY67_02675 [Klebsiella pneumoniae]
MISDNKVTYHEVDFLLPAQRFNIQFSYVSQKGLPFIREFVIRLVHVASMSKAQIATYFGLTHRETEEAISDLVQRGELTLSSDGRLTLTDKSNGYFSEVGEIPHLSTWWRSTFSTSLIKSWIKVICLTCRLRAEKNNLLSIQLILLISCGKYRSV